MQKPALLVSTSTFPRWEGDREPRFVYDLSQRLAGDFEVHILAPHAPGACKNEKLGDLSVHRFRYNVARFESLAYEGGILSKLHRRPLRLALVPVFLLAQLLAVRRLSRERRFSVIHAHWIIPQGLCAVAAQLGLRRKVPVVCTSHGGDLYALQGRALTTLKRWVIRRCAAVTVVSRAMAEEVARLAPGCSAQVMSMGTDLTALFVPDERVPRLPRTLLFVGRLVEKKGLRYLIDALALLKKDYPDVELWIAGSGPEETRLKEQAARLGLGGAVRFLGSLAHEDLPELYRTATLTVVPSVVAAGGDQEGLGLVIVEAMGCECPVVASDLPAIRDVLEDAETGLLARPGDATHLAERIAHLLERPDLRSFLGRQARAFVLPRFDWQVTAPRYADLFRRCAARSIHKSTRREEAGGPSL